MEEFCSSTPLFYFSANVSASGSAIREGAFIRYKKGTSILKRIQSLGGNICFEEGINSLQATFDCIIPLVQNR